MDFAETIIEISANSPFYGTGNSVIVKIVPGGELCGVPVWGGWVQLVVKGVRYLRHVRKIAISTAIKLDSCRGKGCSR